jgi:hypothetical protein
MHCRCADHLHRRHRHQYQIPETAARVGATMTTTTTTTTIGTMEVDVQSSAAVRAARGTGLERPDPGGEKSCRLAVGSADMLCLAGYGIMSE